MKKFLDKVLCLHEGELYCRPNRIWYLECLRVLAMLSVIAFHVGKTALTDFDSTLFSYAGFLAVRNVVHYAVPIFFMISGALLLNPEKTITIERLYKRYLLKYFTITLVFSGGYACIEQIFNQKAITAEGILIGLDNMLHGDSWAHMWYMYALLWVMMLIPFLRLAAEKFGKAEIRCTIAFVLLFVSFTAVINAYSKKELGITYPVNFIYCFYMLMGYWLHNNVIRIKKKYCLLAISCSVLALIIFGFVDIYGIANCEPWIGNHSPLIVIYSVSLFALGKQIIKEEAENHMIYKVITILSAYSFPIYLIHMFWLNILYKAVKLNPFLPVPVIGFAVVYVIVFVLSLISAVILKKIPIVSKMF